MNAADPIIRLQQINKFFGTFRALADVSLDIRSGEKVVVLGPSGSGKSTLLRTINRLESIDSGTIIVDGHNLYGEGADINRIRMEVGMVFQNFNLFRHKSVLDNLTLAPIKLKMMGRAQAEELAMSLLDKVGMRDRAHHFPVQLSGGQQQRVAIARAIVNKPRVLLLDEPLSALDHRLRKQMQKELKQLQRTLGITFLLVTHDQDEAFAMSDRVVVMQQGRIEQIGTPMEIYEEPVNLYVARFVGDINVLDGVIREQTGSTTFIALVEGAVVRLRSNRALNLGQSIHVLLRPEDFRLELEQDIAQSRDLSAKFQQARLKGTVRRIFYHGATYDVEVSLESGTRVQVTEFFDDDSDNLYFKPGDSVALGWHEGWEVVLPHED
jgi:spermidine/putrescine transport system ATP-binding protein